MRYIYIRLPGYVSALVKDLLNKDTEGHHDAFGRVEPDYGYSSQVGRQIHD
jgi:hypothetical protein